MPEFRSSPSGIGVAKLCVARGVAKYVWGYEEPETAPMREGTRLHRIVQAYLRDGVVPAVEEVAARKMIEVLPVGARSIEPRNTERVMLLDEHHGYIDWSQDYRHGDLKFTKSTYYQQKKDPTEDPQRIMYAKDAFANDSSLRTLKQSWSISQFNGEKALTLEHTWVKNDAYKAYDRIIRPIHDTLAEAVATNLHWKDAPKNPLSCDTYPPNGCMMKQHGCRPSLKARLVAITPKPKKKDTKKP